VSWGHEPEMPKSFKINGGVVRFMERGHLRIADVSWGHEPEMPKSFKINGGVVRFMEREHLKS
jgi:predicted DNA-binding transcriptional regulator AlpA